jgi:hypothetical protein
MATSSPSIFMVRRSRRTRADFGSVYGSRSPENRSNARRGPQAWVVPRPAARSNAGGRLSGLPEGFERFAGRRTARTRPVQWPEIRSKQAITAFCLKEPSARAGGFVISAGRERFPVRHETDYRATPEESSLVHFCMSGVRSVLIVLRLERPCHGTRIHGSRPLRSNSAIFHIL